MYTFQEMIGNEPIKKQLQIAIAKKYMSHAYIIQGQQGSGKKQLATTIAKTMECQEQGMEPCNQCASCYTVDSGNHPDIFYVKAEKGKSIGVEDIREQLIRNMEVKQYHYPYKIFIVPQADTMTIAAQNALLKTLEEPPSYGIILLLAQNLDSFLSTILSRCTVIKLRPLATKDIESYLQRQQLATAEEAAIFAEYAQGSIGKAIEIASSETFSAMRQDIIEKILSLPQKNIAEVLLLAKELEQYKEQTSFLELLYLWYRDVFLYQLCKEDKFLLQKDKYKEIQQQAKELTEESLVKKLNAITLAKQQLASNSNFLLTMEVLLMKLKER